MLYPSNFLRALIFLWIFTSQLVAADISFSISKPIVLTRGFTGECAGCVGDKLGRKSEKMHCETASKIVSFALSKHLQHRALNPKISERTFENFQQALLSIDGLFIEKDINEIKKQIESQRKFSHPILKNTFENQECAFFEHLVGYVRKAFDTVSTLFPSIEELTQAILNHSVDSIFDNKTPKNHKELKTQILNKLYQKYDFWKNEVNPTQSAKYAALQYWRGREKFQTALEVFAYEQLTRAFVRALDAHSGFSLSEKERHLQQDVSDQQFHVGVVLEEHPYGAKIKKILENSPAKESLLEEGDIIYAVDDQSIEGFSVSEITQRIRGPQHSSVKFSIGHMTGGRLHPLDDETLIRKKVPTHVLEIFSSRKQLQGFNIVTIHLTSFFWLSAQALEREILKQKEQGPIDGLILDLRDNPGGILVESIKTVGLFINTGPVLGLNSFQSSHIEIERDLDPKVAYDGPLIVAVNNGSASASEIVAGALQDYGRALIVGGEHTLGKATMQVLHFDIKDVPVGMLRLTQEQIYTAGGGSPQWHGVQSNIIVPGPMMDSIYEEKNQLHAVSPGKLTQPLFSWKEQKENRDPILLSALLVLRKSSEARIKSSVNFSAQVQLEEIQNITTDFIKLHRTGVSQH